MSDKGTKVFGPIIPIGENDSAPTHLAKYGKGGSKAVNTIEERDAIPSERLELGCSVYVISEATEYILDALDEFGRRWIANKLFVKYLTRDEFNMTTKMNSTMYMIWDSSGEKVEEIYVGNNPLVQSSMKEDIDKLMGAVFPLKLNSYTGGGTYEVGKALEAKFDWTYDRDIDSQTFDGAAIDKSLRTKTVSIAATSAPSTKAYALVGKSGSLTVSGSQSIAFKWKKYWGVSEKTTLTNEDILALAGNTWADSRAMNATSFNCTGGKYPYYVIPTSIASGLEVWIGGLRNTDLVTTTMDLTNANGKVVNVTVIRLATIQTGILSIQFK